MPKKYDAAGEQTQQQTQQESAAATPTTTEQTPLERAELERDNEGSIIRTWGTGTGKKTMSLHIRKSYYTNLGWDIGDFLFMQPNFEKGEIVIKKVDTEKLKRKR
jgi:hypothetical protein